MKIYGAEVGGYGPEVGATIWFTVYTLHAVSLYTPSRERKYTFSEYAKHLYRARKRVCCARSALNPHKSKVQTILPARNIHEKIITPKIKCNFLDRKKIEKNVEKNLRKKFPKNPKNFQKI